MPLKRAEQKDLSKMSNEELFLKKKKLEHDLAEQFRKGFEIGQVNRNLQEIKDILRFRGFDGEEGIAYEAWPEDAYNT